MNFKENIAKELYIAIKTNYDVSIDVDTIEKNIEVPKDKTNGDYAFPCFNLSKTLKKAPFQIATELKDAIQENSVISHTEVINGFLNFYIQKEIIVKNTIEKFAMQKEEYGKSNMGEGKNIIVEYSSPNIAKPFHIGHLKTTIIGNSLYHLYKFLGFNTIGINHLGDYGTQFAKLIEGYKRWGNEYDFEKDPIDKLSQIYVRINELCEKDESVLEECRQTFKKLEDGDEYCVNLWNKFKSLSLQEFEKIYKLLDVKFDSMNGESFYSDKMQEVIDILEKSGKVEESNGAKIIDLTSEGIKTPCIIQKSNGSSIYATRDLAAILYRARTYDFDKCLYVVGEEQALHFKQVFAVSKYLGLDEKYTNGLEHVSYGMIRLPEGKMSSRKGNFVKVKDLLEKAISKVNEIMIDKEIDDKEEVSKEVGVGAVIFDDLKDSRIKNQVFDLNAALNFNGETGPYVQYTAVRTASILNKTEFDFDEKKVNAEKLTDEDSINVIKLIANFENILVLAMQKNEPSIIARYILELSKTYSSFYNNNKVICDDQETKYARLYLTYMTKCTLTNGLKLLGIKVPRKM